jgi:hypothetical protein
MDKVTVKDSDVVYSQVLFPVSFNGDYFAYTLYDIVDIIEIFKFNGAGNKLELLTKGVDYTFNRNKIIFSSIPSMNYTVSVRYVHKLVYAIIDIPHVVRNSYRKPAPTGREQLQNLPVHSIGRLLHYVVDSQNFAGDNIFDNSYATTD